MKLKRLELKAFGPFTGRTLLFDSGDPGLHIIFGPNEAGKSSALRGLKALFYGFPQQTPDNFLHSYDQLLVGGCLENGNGDQIYFQRRKKRLGSIIDAQGNPLDPKKLLPFLHGMEPEIFESLYGIDHDSLVRGGEEILAQKGEVGQALFAAGAGISSLREVIDQLEDEAAELFKPAGQRPEINRAIKRFKDLKKEAKAANLSIKKWQDHQKTLNRAAAERKSLETERNSRHKELRHLERLQQAIPELASLKALRDQLREQGEVTLLSPDFAERYQKTDQKIHDARSQLQRDLDQLVHIRKKREAISCNQKLLQQADAVGDLHQRLGAYNKGQRDKPQINGIRINLRREAALLLKQVKPDLMLDDIELLRPVLLKKRTIQSLTTQYAVINQQLKQTLKKSKAAAGELEQAQKNLPGPAEVIDFQNLHRAVKIAQKAGDIDAFLAQGHDDIERGKKHCLTELKRTGVPSDDLTVFMERPLPLAETVQRFEKDFHEFAEENRELEKEQRESIRELENTTAEIKKAEYGGDIPSEEELISSRERREQGWKLLRRQWLNGQDVTIDSAAYNSEKPLPEAYEEQVAQADQVGDRLRREAERVANMAALRTRRERLEEVLKNNEKQQEILNHDRQDLDAAWSEIWAPAGVVPLPPKEMISFLAQIDKLRYKVGDIITKENAVAQDSRRRKHLREALLRELKLLGEEEIPVDETLGSTLVFAETILEKLADQRLRREKIKERREKAQQTFDQTRAELGTDQDGLAEWDRQWKEALESLGLPADTTVHEALDLIETLQNCFDRVKEADDIKKRIEGIDRDTAELRNDVQVLLKKASLASLMKLPLDQAIPQLRTTLSQAQKDSTLYNKLSEELDDLQLKVSNTEKTVHSVSEQMDELLRIAGCEKPEDVAVVIARFTEHQRLQEKISDTKTTLAKIGVGVSIEELTRQAAAVDIEELPARLKSLQQDIDEKINPGINRISQEIGEQTTILAAMDGNAGGAEIAEKMEQELTRIRRLAERYALVKLASKILQQEIERYREEHQDPVLKIGSRYLSALTMNSLQGIKTDVNDKGDAILVGVRPNDSWITVGGMSDGTRDQLYLALRLATLESRLDSSEPIPFIVDDILINFDDDRSRATLKALAELGSKNQVILFTHHRQIMEEAKALQNEREIVLHEL